MNLLKILKNKLLNVCNHPHLILVHLLDAFSWMITSDELFLKWMFRLRQGYPLNLVSPKTYSEKIQWLKLYNRKPEYTTLVDKVKVKDWVAGKIGSEYIIPTLGVYKKAEDIDFNELPDQFVLKCNHNSGEGMFICKDKSSMDETAVRNNLNKGLAENLYMKYREWPYKNVERRIIAEKYMKDSITPTLNDYKIMCFDGKVKLIELHQGRFTEKHTQDFYDRDWNKTSIAQGSYGETSKEVVDRPALLDKMIELSEILATDIPHVRVDWYIVDGKLYFGEMTLFDGAGLDPWDRYEDDLLMGSWLTLPEKTI